MEQCLRWFLVGFNAHFHKLTSIAKKPFNSILGETFTGEFVLGAICEKRVGLTGLRETLNVIANFLMSPSFIR